VVLARLISIQTKVPLRLQSGLEDIPQGAKPGQPQHMTYRAFDGGNANWTVSTGDWQKVLPDDCP
jgi:hypothetical protein